MLWQWSNTNRFQLTSGSTKGTLELGITGTHSRGLGVAIERSPGINFGMLDYYAFRGSRDDCPTPKEIEAGLTQVAKRSFRRG